jgi:glycosyltransferase involved in cell wall biosynthesis
LKACWEVSEQGTAEVKIILDLRKYDGVVGGVEQGAIQVARQVAAGGDEVLMICKAGRRDQLDEIMRDVDGLTLVPVDVETHSMCEENEQIDSGFLQDLADREHADLIHFFYNWSFPANKKVPSILTVHDVIPFTFREAMDVDLYNTTYKPGIQRACELNDIIATVSEYSRQDIAKKVGVPLEKIFVVPNGLREPAPDDSAVRAELTERFQLEQGFILNAGGIHERKNIPNLVKAFAQLCRDDGFRGKLVITGKASGAPYQEKMRKVCDAVIEESGMAVRVVLAGFVTEQELDILLRMARAFVYPSLYEGFGIPILEAMKVGTPVVTSNATAMPEVAGGAAVLIDPNRVDDMKDGISRVITDETLREDLVARGLKRSAEYSWKRTRDEYMALYRKVTGQG